MREPLLKRSLTVERKSLELVVMVRIHTLQPLMKGSSMEIKLYKLWNSETKKFNAGGDNWTKAGKCWDQKNHLSTKLTADAQQFAEWELGHSASYDLQYDKDRREELYQRFIPDTWIVIELTNNGAREICKAKDWLKYK